MWSRQETRERVGELESLIADLTQRQDGLGAAAVQALVDVYGEALERIMSLADEALTGALTDDELVCHLLLVHDLHPLDAAARIRAALDGLRSDARAELLDLAAGVATVRLDSGRHDVVEATVLAAAPEVREVHLEPQAPAPTTAFVPLTAVRAR